MSGDSDLGDVLRELRKARGLTLAAVARRAGCAESLISYVESGRRRLHHWLAVRLDEIYRCGGVVTSLMRSAGTREGGSTGVSSNDTLLVELPEGGVSMPLSRRELLAALSVGVAGGTFLGQFDSALAGIRVGDHTLRDFDDAYVGFQAAARTLPPSAVIDGLTGKVAVLDGLRRQSRGRTRQRYSRMLARYAESLSWLSEEAEDLSAAGYWIDRASQWGQAADWQAMSAYACVRRSMMVISFSGNGSRAIDNAEAVLAMRDVSPRLRGLATKQIAFSHALSGNEDESKRALHEAMALLSQPVRDDDSVLGQRSVVSDALFAIFKATCDIYLGRGESVVPALLPHMDSLSRFSVRTATITKAKLARAYANAGQPAEAAALSLEAANDSERIGSLSARSELLRALPLLNRWHGREDVQLVVRRLRPSA